MPSQIDPMLAVSGKLPVDQSQYTFEYKWDGVRAIGYFSPGTYRLLARSGNDITARYPEIANLAEALGNRHLILDGEIVSLNESGRPDFGRLQHRMHLHDARAVARLSKSDPVFYVLFDVLHMDGRSLLDEPYTSRRAVLEDLTLMGANWQITPAHVGEGTTMHAAAKQNQLEGLVAKRLDSPYRPGQRSGEWIKIKIIQRQEFVVAGWIPEKTGTAGRIGALLVGYYDQHGKLRFAGKVGTGLSAADHQPLLKKLTTGRTDTSPFSDADPDGAIFTRKPAVAEIEYRRWPVNGLLQQAAYKGLRTDKAARDVVRENCS
jgi:bifunctional non-homologous end joining protein LigD